MSSLGVKAVNADGHPALLILIDFETVGETEISYAGIDLADITEATIKGCFVVLDSLGGGAIKPKVSIRAKVGADLTTAGILAVKALGKSSVNELVDDATDALKRAVNSSEYLGPVGKYLTEAFVQLAERGHKFHALGSQRPGLRCRALRSQGGARRGRRG